MDKFITCGKMIGIGGLLRREARQRGHHLGALTTAIAIAFSRKVIETSYGTDVRIFMILNRKMLSKAPWVLLQTI